VELDGANATHDVSAPTQESVVRERIEQVLTRTSSPAFLKSNGLPVVFAYSMSRLLAVAWTRILSALQAQGTPVLVVGDAGGIKYDPVRWGSYQYDPNWQSAEEVLAWDREQAADKRYLADPTRLFAATVSPGFNDQDRPALTVARGANGERYAETWDAALASQPDWVLVDSWNEWYEGSTVEPSMTYGDTALQQTEQYTAEFRRLRNDLPIATADSFTVSEDQTLHVGAPGVIANDTDADGDALTPTVVDEPTTGTLALNSDGSFDYQPSSDFNGVDHFRYAVSDPNGGRSETTTVTMTIAPTNDPPSGGADAYQASEDAPLTVNAPGVLTNDSDVDGDLLSVTLVTGPAHGTLALDPSGGFVYTPTSNFNGPDSFVYSASDRSGSATANVLVSIDVAPAPDAPVAIDDAATTGEDAILYATPGVLSNDSDVDGDALSAAVVNAPTHGTVTLNTNGSYTYVPAANFNGSDSFTYRASDGGSASAPATVRITVVPVNDAPVAAADSFSISTKKILTVAAPGVLKNDSDVDGNLLTATLAGGPSSGTLSLKANGSFTYTPKKNFVGIATFTYRVSDGTLSSVSVTVTINVTR
jgi:VCBS repeat-containing protein